MATKTRTAKGPTDLAGFNPYRDKGDCYYDAEAAEKPVEFIESFCQFIEGDKAGQPLKLEKWQADIVRTIFGWKRPDGRKRFSMAYIEVPRGNGKSTLCAALVLYLLGCDGEKGAQVYSVAGTKDQAAHVYRPASIMVADDEVLRGEFKVNETCKRIVHAGSHSFYEVISADEKTSHGQTPYAIIFDELHTQKTRGLWDTLTSALVKRSRSLLIAITTAGDDKTTICWEQHSFAERVRDGVIPSRHFLPVLYAAGEKDDWTKEKTWRKANPNYGVSVDIEKFKEACAKAQANPAEENKFRRLHLNQWTEQSTRAFSMVDWNSCKREIDWNKYAGRSCFAGLDLAKTRDLTAFVRIYMETDGDAKRYVLRPMFFLPEYKLERLERSTNIPYSRWVKQGLLISTPGRVTDYNYVRRYINDAHLETPIRNCGFDTWNAAHLSQELMIQDGIKMTEIGQYYRDINLPTQEFIASVESGLIVHDGQEVMTWNASNFEVREDPAGNKKPVKPKDGTWQKIDGCVAAIMGIAVAMADDGLEDCYNDKSFEEPLIA